MRLREIIETQVSEWLTKEPRKISKSSNSHCRFFCPERLTEGQPQLLLDPSAAREWQHLHPLPIVRSLDNRIRVDTGILLCRDELVQRVDLFRVGRLQVGRGVSSDRVGKLFERVCSACPIFSIVTSFEMARPHSPAVGMFCAATSILDNR